MPCRVYHILNLLMMSAQCSSCSSHHAASNLGVCGPYRYPSMLCLCCLSPALAAAAAKGILFAALWNVVLLFSPGLLCHLWMRLSLWCGFDGGRVLMASGPLPHIVWDHWGVLLLEEFHACWPWLKLVIGKGWFGLCLKNAFMGVWNVYFRRA